MEKNNVTIFKKTLKHLTEQIEYTFTLPIKSKVLKQTIMSLSSKSNKNQKGQVLLVSFLGIASEILRKQTIKIIDTSEMSLSQIYKIRKGISVIPKYKHEKIIEFVVTCPKYQGLAKIVKEVAHSNS